MICYGDREYTRRAEDLLEAARAETDPTARAIGVGILTQALLDREFHARGEDELSALRLACSAANDACGRALVHGGSAALDALIPHAQGTLTLRHPEGYAFYAVYPELYAAAATEQPELQVIGIRSIGCSLASVVAAASGSARMTHTVRPVGHPFERRLKVGAQLREVLRGAPAYAIVDEGPGLSGSSFEAVASWLDVAREHVRYFPSHPGEPGAMASDATRAHYRATKRGYVGFEDHFPASRLSAWFEDRTGRASLAELSGGRWRQYVHSDAPSQPRDERRKYLLRSAQGSFLMKFSGLGGLARELGARAQALSDEGFTPRLLAIRHGFALSAFHAQATSLAALPRAALIAQLARYLSWLRAQGAAHSNGASLGALSSMAEHNLQELWGLPFDAALPDRASPVAIDGKLERWEWIVHEGALLKCDAEDHHAGHDCIGAQDIAWDVAGAIIELELDAAEAHALCRQLAVKPAELRFYTRAYVAFKAGRAQQAIDALTGWADDDAARWRVELVRYRRALRETERR